MTLFVEYDPVYEDWEITQNSTHGGVLNTAPTRKQAVQMARNRYARDGEDIAVKGPRMNQFKQV
jgi:hypothetical protein